jgi:hypothetical protein
VKKLILWLAKKVEPSLLGNPKEWTEIARNCMIIQRALEQYKDTKNPLYLDEIYYCSTQIQKACTGMPTEFDGGLRNRWAGPGS